MAQVVEHRAVLASRCALEWWPLAVVPTGRRDRAPARMPALPGQCEEWSGERRPEGAALIRQGKSEHGRLGAWPVRLRSGGSLTCMRWPGPTMGRRQVATT